MKMKLWRLSACFSLCILYSLWLIPNGFAAVPGQINFQGKITDNTGSALSGDFSLIFKIYHTATGGTPVWNETQIVAVSGGLCNATLGTNNPILPKLFDGTDKWLEITVGNDVLSPRQKFNSVTYGFYAQSAYDANNATGNFTVAGNLYPGNIGGRYIYDNNFSTNYATGFSSAVIINGNLQVNKAISGFGIVPVGSIIAWHKSFTGTPSLPDGWVECNGQTINDAESPYHLQTIPDLNNQARFLRGALTSGTTQNFQLENKAVLFKR